MTEELDKHNFQKIVEDPEVPTLVDFWAQWCGPCHAIAPVLEEIDKEYDGKVRIGKVNVDEHPELAQKYGVTSIPNLKFFKQGEVVDEIIGVAPKGEIKSRIDSHL